MLKKIALLVVLFALPLGAMAQKFAHMNSQEVIVVMPEYTKAQADLEAMSKKYTQEMERTQSEFNKKVQEFQQQADSLPRNIAERPPHGPPPSGDRTPRGWYGIPSSFLFTSLSDQLGDLALHISADGGVVGGVFLCGGVLGPAQLLPGGDGVQRGWGHGLVHSAAAQGLVVQDKPQQLHLPVKAGVGVHVHKGILLQEVFSQHPGDLQRQLVVGGAVLFDQLDDLVQLVLLLQKVHGASACSG